MEYIPKLKGFIAPGTSDIVAFRYLYGRIEILSREAVFIKNSPHAVIRLTFFNRFGFQLYSLIDHL